MTSAGIGPRGHITVLDGWRGASILLVLAGHLFPLSPKSVRMNETIAAMGMVLFKYAKRPLLIAALFLLAHVSTRYFESRFIEAGRSLANRWTGGRKQEAAP